PSFPASTTRCCTFASGCGRSTKPSVNRRTAMHAWRLKLAILAPLAIALIGLLVMSLWNWLMPAVFGLHTVTYWQALGLLLLSKLFFSSFSGRGPNGRWRERVIDRWEKLTPEEREKFREAMRRRHGFGGDDPHGATSV